MDHARIEVRPTVRIDDEADIARAYTPGVAEACQAIAGDPGTRIAAPQCFEVEGGLRDELDVPVFHDDQHRTAIVVLAALGSALRLVGKQLSDVRILVCGAGAAGAATVALLREASTAAQIAAAHAIADAVSNDTLDARHVVPSVFDERLVPAVARAVAEGTQT